MNTLITSGVKVTVTTQFRQDFSSLSKGIFFFNYRVDIFNKNEYEIQLKTRIWYIFDSLNEASLVHGNGVIGMNPIIKPGEKYSYTSACDLRSEIGFMKGHYTFENKSNNVLFSVEIPKFNLEFPGKLN